MHSRESIVSATLYRATDRLQSLLLAKPGAKRKAFNVHRCINVVLAASGVFVAVAGWAGWLPGGGL